jgi:DNA sulfur modification protein DndB
MSTTIPAIRSRMGSRDYYIAKMSAAELAGQVSIASELEDWKTQTLEDVYQRELNKKRVEQEIAPYLATTADRFFGSIIILIRDQNAISFEDALQFSDNLLAAYRNHARDIGFLTIGTKQGGLVALDGQHRLAALRHVVQGDTDGPFRDAVSNDEIAVIFIDDTDIAKARELFTMLNRSARKVSKKDVLIMSESDGSAIVARRLTSSQVMNPRSLMEHPLVKWGANTIGQRDTEFTTLNALWALSKIVAEFMKVKFDEDEDDDDNVPEERDIVSIFDTCEEWLGTLFDSCQDFADMRHDYNLIVDGRKKESPYSLILRPVGFILFFEAVAKALNPSVGGFKNVGDVIERLLRLDWSLDATMWKGIMVDTRSRVSNKAADRKLAADLAVWMITGEKSPTPFVEDLRIRLQNQYNRSDIQLPSPSEA